MRTKGTKYPKVKTLPEGALPVSKYATKHKIPSAAYVHVKYDRHVFGYTTKKGKTVFAPEPGYKIIDFYGTCYVVES